MATAARCHDCATPVRTLCAEIRCRPIRLWRAMVSYCCCLLVVWPVISFAQGGNAATGKAWGRFHGNWVVTAEDQGKVVLTCHASFGQRTSGKGEVVPESTSTCFDRRPASYIQNPTFDGRALRGTFYASVGGDFSVRAEGGALHGKILRDRPPELKVVFRSLPLGDRVTAIYQTEAGAVRQEGGRDYAVDYRWLQKEWQDYGAQSIAHHLPHIWLELNIPTPRPRLLREQVEAAFDDAHLRYAGNSRTAEGSLLVTVQLLPGARPGQKTLFLNSARIPFDLRFENHEHAVKANAPDTTPRENRGEKAVMAAVKRASALCPKQLYSGLAEDYQQGDVSRCMLARVPPSLADTGSGKADASTARRLEAFLRRQPDLIGEQAPGHEVAAACPLVAALSASEQAWLQTRLVAEYYVSRRRLIDGVMASLQSLAFLDAVRGMQCPQGGTDEPGIGQSFAPRLLAAVEPGDVADVPGGETTVRQLRSDCPDRYDFSRLVFDTDLALVQTAELRKAINPELEQRWGHLALSYDGHDLRPDLIAAYQQFNERRRRLALAESSNIWMHGSGFSARYDALLAACEKEHPSAGKSFCEEYRPNFVCAAIKAEADQTAVAIRGHLVEFRDALQCLGEQGCPMSPTEFRQLVAKAPPFAGFPAGRDEPLLAFANWLASDIACRGEVYAATQDREQAWWDFAKGVGTTVVTGWLSSAAKVYAAAAANARSAGAAAQALRASSMARRLEGAALAVDLVEGSHGVARSLAQALRQCGDLLAPGSALPAAQGRPQCPLGADYQGHVVQQDYDSCLLRALAWDVVSTLPTARSAVKYALDRTLLRAAQAALPNIQLSRTQRQAVLDLFGGNLGQLTAAEIEQGIEALRKADFSEPQINRLFAELAPEVRVRAGASAAAADDSFATWTKTLNDRTQRALDDDADLRRRFRDMDPKLRGVLARCGELCIRPNTRPEQTARIEAIIARFGLDAEQRDLLGDYLLRFRGRLNKAVLLLEGFDDTRKLTAFMTPVPGRILSATTVMPDGARLRTTETLPDGSVRAIYQVGDRIDRARYEAQFLPARKGLHRAHLVPPGHGVEDPGGLSYATSDINLGVDQQMDNWIRDLYQQAKSQGYALHVTATLKRNADGSVASKNVVVELVSPTNEKVLVRPRDGERGMGYMVDATTGKAVTYPRKHPAWGTEE